MFFFITHFVQIDIFYLRFLPSKLLLQANTHLTMKQFPGLGLRYGARIKVPERLSTARTAGLQTLPETTLISIKKPWARF